MVQDLSSPAATDIPLSGSGPIPADPTSGAAADPAAAPDARPLSRRGLERLDLMLLCLEALDLNGGEAMVWLCEQMGYSSVFPSRVALWQGRCHNPLRRTCRRGNLDSRQTEALIQILAAMADRLYPLLRSLLSGSDPPEVNAERWQLFQGRLSELLRERMNMRRSGVHSLIDPLQGAQQRRALVRSLALGAGSGGAERLRASLLDAAA
ncbi:MAG: DUF3038 domain-containing protein [Synechococcaceae cyanobacterium]|nr:DUF3038 domain-containing protein [Synechococcaceae cyanobacterium]